MNLWVNMVLAFYAGFVINSLALSFLGIYNSLKKSIIPVFSFTFIIFISKFVFHAPPVTHTLVLVVFCSIFIFLFNKFDIIMSLISSLLVMIVIIIGSLLIVCPLLVIFDVELVTDNFESIDWLIFNIGELSIPSIILIINKVKRTSMIKHILKIDRNSLQNKVSKVQ